MIRAEVVASAPSTALVVFVVFVAPSSSVLVVFVTPGQVLGPAVAPDDAIFVAALLERWQAPLAQKEK